MFWNVLTYRGKCVLILKSEQSAFEIVPANLCHVTCYLYIYIRMQCEDKKREARDDDERETKTRDTHEAKSVAVRESRI